MHRGGLKAELGVLLLPRTMRRSQSSLQHTLTFGLQTTLLLRKDYLVLVFAQLGCFGGSYNLHKEANLCPQGCMCNFSWLYQKSEWSSSSTEINPPPAPSTADNAKMDFHMHIQMDIHGNPGGYLGSAGGGPWPFFGWCMKEKEELLPSFSFASLEFSLGSRIEPAKISCGDDYCYNKKGDGSSKTIFTK